MFLEVQCPNDGEKCLVAGCETKESMILLGDDEQNMQCTQCGYASNKNYKDKVVEFPEEFQSVCKEVNGRWWMPAVYQTKNYLVVPAIEEEKLVWIIRTRMDTKATEVTMPSFYDAYAILQIMETKNAQLSQQE
tara:strand:- start:36 stop:437 length:402 start_codon:yes stop_codon:yes gene_type:complete